MKKKIIATVVITGLLIAGSATANYWGNRGGGGMGMYPDCPRGYNMTAPQIDQATQDKISQFFQDNRQLQRDIVVKQAEKRAMMRSGSPDAQAVARLTGELFDLRTTLHEKAVEAGIDQYIGGRGFGMGGGKRGMMGHGFRGRGGYGYGMQNAPEPQDTPQDQQ